MTNLINAGQTMTSMRIAEITGKQHKDVLRAIRNMEHAWEKTLGRKFALQFRINKLATGGENKTPYYELTKIECLYIATKFNDEARARLILRWEELENERLTSTQQPVKAEVLHLTDEKCAVFFADSEEMCKFAAFTRERHSFKASPENINGINSAEVSCVSNGAHLNGVSSLVNSTHPRTFLFMFTRENQVCLYNGSPVTFNLGDGTARVNATQMAKPFGKLVGNWLQNSSTKEFLEALSTDIGKPISALIQTVRGGNGEQGTWMYEDAALEFARWLSPKFAIWCNRRIKELLTSTPPPVKAEVLPPPIENQTVTPPLVECIDGKLFTTSRKLAQALGRKHDRILETIRSNRHLRAFKYGHFTTRAYSSGASHGYEFLITRKGLDALASVMRYNAKERIAQAYEGAWDSSIRGAVLPTTKALPAPIQSHDQEETTHTSEQQEYIDWLEGYNEELGSRLRKTKNTMKLYSELYSQEMNRRKRAEGMSGYWHDLYEDLMLRMEGIGDNAMSHMLEAHRAFRSRLESKG